MRNTLIYGLSLRLFHWIFAGLFLFSFIVAQTVEGDQLLFSFHMLSGLMLGFVSLLRILGFFVGDTHALFKNLTTDSQQTKQYFLDAMKSKTKLYVGHNPATSWLVVILVTLALALAGTGILMASGGPEFVKEIHEITAKVFLLFVLGHAAGLVFHYLRHKDSLHLSMIDGKKNVPSEHQQKQGWLRAFAFSALVLSMGTYLYKNFDPQTRNLHAFGMTLQLSEIEDESGSESGSEGPESSEAEDE